EPARTSGGVPPAGKLRRRVRLHPARPGPARRTRADVQERSDLPLSLVCPAAARPRRLVLRLVLARLLCLRFLRRLLRLPLEGALLLLLQPRLLFHRLLSFALAALEPVVGFSGHGQTFFRRP